MRGHFESEAEPYQECSRNFINFKQHNLGNFLLAPDMEIRLFTSELYECEPPSLLAFLCAGTSGWEGQPLWRIST